MAKGYVPVVCTQGKIIGAMIATSFLFFAAFPISTSCLNRYRLRSFQDTFQRIIYQLTKSSTIISATSPLIYLHVQTMP
jgi:hypothetical protein